jgi:hypothetical protein
MRCVRQRIVRKANARHLAQEEGAMMRKTFSWFAWSVLFALPIVFAIQIFILEDIPRVEWWKWVILLATVLVLYFSRDRDEVLKHRLV